MRLSRLRSNQGFTRNPSHFAFTLLELLVVCSIISILIALLLSSISRAKISAQAASCRNNHRQLIVGWIQYADDNPRIMPNLDGIEKPPTFTNWVSGDIQTAFVDAKNPSVLTDPNKSLMANYVPSAKTYKCPSDPSQNIRSVSMNMRLNPVRLKGLPNFTEGANTNYAVYRTREEIRQPTEIFVTLDERYDSINEAYFAVDLSNTGMLDGNGTVTPFFWVDTPAGYHKNACSFSFADGHVGVRTWVEKTTLGPIGIVGIRRVKSDDVDIRWLQEHTAERK